MKGDMKGDWLKLMKLWARLLVWVFGMLMAGVAVAEILKNLSGMTYWTLLILLILFMVASVISWIFEVNEMVPKKATKDRQ